MAHPQQLHLVVPNLNGADYVAATLESLNAQGEAVRWWFQDGASKDDSVEIARRLARPGDEVRSEQDSGQPAAINAALADCGGEIIGYLNSDDLLLEGAAETVLEAFAENPDADIVVGGVQLIDASGKPTGDEHFGNLSSLADSLDIYHFWFAEKHWVQPEVFFRRSLFEKVGGFHEDMYLAFDYDFWVRCFRHGAKVVRVPQLLAGFRLHDAQKSADAEAASREVRDTALRHLEDCWDQLPPIRRRLMRARIDYDRYARGEGEEAGEPFFAMLGKNPLWALNPWVRQRIGRSLSSKVGR